VAERRGLRMMQTRLIAFDTFGRERHQRYIVERRYQ
jgi:hypothetical protein